MRLHKTSWNLLALRQICIPAAAAASTPSAPASVLLHASLLVAMLQIYKWKFRQEHFLLNFRIRFLTIARLSHSTRKFSCQSLCLSPSAYLPALPCFAQTPPHAPALCCAHLIVGPAAQLGGCQTSNFGIPSPFMLSTESSAIYTQLQVCT